MREILYHLLSFCGEGHISIMTLFYTGVIVVYRDFLLTIWSRQHNGYIFSIYRTILRGVKNVLFKWGVLT